MSPKPPVWCAKCNLRIAPYDLLTTYRGANYHQDCFLRLVREEADEQRREQALGRLRSSESGEHTKASLALKSAGLQEMPSQSGNRFPD